MPGEDSPFYLRSLEVAEVSLVDKAANKRKFLVFKSEESVMAKKGEGEVELVLDNLSADMIGVLKAATEEGDKEMEESINGLEISEKAKAAIRAAARTMSAARKEMEDEDGEMPDDVAEQVAKLLGVQSKKVAKEEKDKVCKSELEETYGLVLKADGTPDFNKVPKDVRKMVEMLWKQNQDTIKKAADLEAVLKAEQDLRATNECIRKAETDYNGLSLKPSDFAPVLKEMQEKLSESTFAEVDRILKASAKAAAAIFKEQGTGGEGGDDQTAYGKLETIAKQYVKDGKAPTFEVAFTKAMDENPDLAAAERAERK